MQTTKSVPAVERALMLLEALDNSARGLNIAELARRLQIPRSTAHSIVLTLERCGYITRDESQRHCTLTSRAYLLGRETMSSDLLGRAARVPMLRLSAQTGLTSHMAMLEDNQAVYIQKARGSSRTCFDTYVGKRTNLHCTAVGKVLLGYAPDHFREKVLDRGTYARYTRNTITLAPALRHELRNVRSQGYALDDQEEELNIRCLAVPVFSARGDTLAALSITGTCEQLRDNTLRATVESLYRTAAHVLEQLRVTESSHAA